MKTVGQAIYHQMNGSMFFEAIYDVNYDELEKGILHAIGGHDWRPTFPEFHMKSTCTPQKQEKARFKHLMYPK